MNIIHLIYDGGPQVRRAWASALREVEAERRQATAQLGAGVGMAVLTVGAIGACAVQ